MEIGELNNLLRPYNITIECSECEAVVRQPFAAQNLNTRVELSAKKTKKIMKVKQTPSEQTENRQIGSLRKCKTERKPQSMDGMSFLPFSPISAAVKTQEQRYRQSTFFAELKQSGDKFLNCPRFENPQNAESLKPVAFDYEATATTLNVAETGKRLGLEEIGSLRKNLFEDVNFGYAPVLDVCLANVIGRNISFENDADVGFELDFGHMPSGAELFSFL